MTTAKKLVDNMNYYELSKLLSSMPSGQLKTEIYTYMSVLQFEQMRKKKNDTR